MKQYNSNTVSSFDAKTHFASLLKKVGAGERITILKHNNPVAMIVPINKQRQESTREIIEDIHNFSKGKKLNGLNIKELINAGRK